MFEQNKTAHRDEINGQHKKTMEEPKPVGINGKLTTENNKR